MSPAGINLDAIDDLAVAVDEINFVLRIESYNSEHVVRFYSAVLSVGLPRGARVINIFIFLNPDPGVGKKIHAIGVVPMHVGNDDVSYVCWREAEFRHGL